VGTVRQVVGTAVSVGAAGYYGAAAAAEAAAAAAAVAVWGVFALRRLPDAPYAHLEEEGGKGGGLGTERASGEGGGGGADEKGVVLEEDELPVSVPQHIGP
jgi:hypothetical protein